MARLVSWLLAQIESDAATARAADAQHRDWQAWCATNLPGADDPSGHVRTWSPARVRAECTAKLAMIEWVLDEAEIADVEWGSGHSAEQIRAGECDCAGAGVAALALGLLAAPYHGRPGWQTEWESP